MISLVPARNYLLKVSKISTRIRCERCLTLRISMITIFNVNDVNDVVLVSLLLTVNIFFLIVDFEQANFCFVHIGKTNIFEDKIGHIIRYVLF